MHISRLIWPALLAAAIAAPATATPPAYHSAFTDYQAWSELTPLSWKESNERVARAPDDAGHDPHQGHNMGHDKAEDPHKGHNMGHDKAPDQPPAQPAPTKPDPHQGH
jgi:hypothetical protein